MSDMTDQGPAPAAPATATKVAGTAALALLCLAQLIVALDYNIVFVALPDIGRALGFNAHTLQWVISAYVITFGGLLLLGGRAVDRLGPRRMLVLGLACYAAGSLAGGLASGPAMMIAMRAVQGAGGALLTPATLGLIGITYAEGHARNRALAAWGAAGSGGLAAGSLLGGVLTSSLGWRWVFFVNVAMSPHPPAAIAEPTATIPTTDLPNEPRPGASIRGEDATPGRPANRLQGCLRRMITLDVGSMITLSPQRPGCMGGEVPWLSRSRSKDVSISRPTSGHRSASPPGHCRSSSPAVQGEREAALDGGDHGGCVADGVSRRAGGVHLGSLRFVAVAPAVLADSDPVSVVAVPQQVL
jgi:hypothetical protein